MDEWFGLSPVGHHLAQGPPFRVAVRQLIEVDRDSVELQSDSIDQDSCAFIVREQAGLSVVFASGLERKNPRKELMLADVASPAWASARMTKLHASEEVPANAQSGDLGIGRDRRSQPEPHFEGAAQQSIATGQDQVQWR
jgi:hypothetical protein